MIGSKSDLTISLVKSAKIGDLEFLKMIYHAGLSNLEDFVTYDNRNIAHIVLLLNNYRLHVKAKFK